LFGSYVPINIFVLMLALTVAKTPTPAMAPTASTA
jgi:hypothetical protein